MNINEKPKTINRRAILVGAGAIPVVAVAASKVGPRDQTAVGKLFSLWLAERELALSASDEFFEVHREQMTEIETEMMPVPASSATDMAAKIIVITGNFGFGIDGANAPVFIAEQYALTGTQHMAGVAS